MIPSRLDRNVGNIENDPLPRIRVTTERLRLASLRGWDLDPRLGELLDDLLSAAAEAEQQVADQRARIAYLESLSNSDELTGLLNRRGFQLELARALARAARRGESGLLLLLDLDHFKAVNDSYGHLAGDAVLRSIAALLRRHTRESDSVARYGGDEFAVLMSGTGTAQAERLAAKLERLVNKLIVPWKGHDIPVSASFGYQAYDAESTADGLFFLADQALYRCKQPCLREVSGARR